jgi:7-cyano-7-deazaguanine synthase
LVETVGFRYGQKHFVELQQRPIVRSAVGNIRPEWKKRLGIDHLIELDLVGQITGKTIVSPAGHGLVAGEGFAAGSRYIPGRNLILLSMCASVAFRRDIRTLVCGASETEYSGYPDCRHKSMQAVEAAICQSTGLDFEVRCPLMWLDKAGVWRLAYALGRDALVETIREDTHTCYAGSREVRHDWGYGCGACDACQLRQKGWREFRALTQD